MDGILLIDKPKGWTSFDVVAKVRSCLRQQLRAKSKQLTAPSPKLKVGHTGTLDPLATGLLILVVGTYTRRAQEFSKMDKTYEVTMRLGMTSTTGDEEGIKTKSSEQRAVNKAEVEEVLQKFVGEIEQVPPAYSAIKINGERAYKLARAGKEVNLESRRVQIYAIEQNSYTYPEVKLTVHVSSGTYIRTLVEDIGKKLGTGAYMTDLRRTKVGKFDVGEALTIESIDAQNVHDRLITVA